MVTKKVRKHSGRYTPRRAGTIPNKEKQDDLIQLVEESYDDWIERRDGIRYNPDKTQIRNPKMVLCDEDKVIEENKRLKIKERIRRMKKSKRVLKN